MSTIRQSLSLVAALLIAGCSAPPKSSTPATPGTDDRVKALADAYLEGWFSRNPDQGTFSTASRVGITTSCPTTHQQH